MNNIYYTGVVEDRQDPKEMGRVRVRVHGLHNPDRNLLKTEDLQWANVLNPINSASVNGIGDSPTGMVEGSVVVIIFLDEFKQQPLVLGTISTRHNKMPNFNQGFTDPNGKYPLKDFIGETDTNRLARGITEKTIVEKKLENKAVNVPTAINGDPWSEPVSYSPEYPLNQTYQSESGHTMEFDDTPDNERVSIAHRTGTYSEINARGTQINHIVGDNYQITDNNGYIYIKGACNITVDGDVNVLTGGNANVQVANNANIRTGGNLNMGVGKDVNWVVDGNFNLKVNGQYKTQTGAYAIDSSIYDLNTGMFRTSTASYDVSATGEMRIDAPRIRLAEGADKANTTTLGLKTVRIDQPIFANKQPLPVPDLTIGGARQGASALSLSSNTLSELASLPQEDLIKITEPPENAEQMQVDETVKEKLSPETVKEIEKLPPEALKGYTPQALGGLASMDDKDREALSLLSGTALCGLAGLPAEILRDLATLPSDTLARLNQLASGAIVGLDDLSTGNILADFTGDLINALSVQLPNALAGFATENLQNLLGIPQELVKQLEGLDAESLSAFNNLPSQVIGALSLLPKDALNCLATGNT